MDTRHPLLSGEDPLKKGGHWVSCEILNKQQSFAAHNIAPILREFFKRFWNGGFGGVQVVEAAGENTSHHLGAVVERNQRDFFHGRFRQRFHHGIEKSQHRVSQLQRARRQNALLRRNKFSEDPQD